MSSEDNGGENSQAYPADQKPTGAMIANTAAHVRRALKGRSIVFVGIMGVGKSTIGWRVAKLLGLPFVDADNEIELAADLTIAEIFEKYGEPYFRAGERKVIERLLKQGNQVLATGGGAFMDEDTRKTIADDGISIWLDADIELIMQRVMQRKTRPLLKQANPRGIIEALLEKRNPIYALADYRFQSHDVARDIIAAKIVTMLGEELYQANQTEIKTHG
jgi:shikimate kinase